MKSGYVIGVDIGTTSTKAVVFNQKGEALNASYVLYPLIKDTPEMAEQDLTDLFEATIESIRKVITKSNLMANEILGVSFSSAMHSLILMDEGNRPLTRCITWADNRASQWAEELRQSEEGLAIYRRTGTPIHPMSPLAKILWLKNAEKALYQKATKFIGIKEYIFFQLFGSYQVDYSSASGSGMFDIFDFRWDQQALSLAGITEDQLSIPVSPTAKISGMPSELAERMGLLPDTPFVFGGNDGCLSNLGVGAVEPGVAALTIGTSGAIRLVVDHPVTDPTGKTFCYILDEEHWVIGGAVNNGGVVLNWARKQFFVEEQKEAIKRGEDAYEILMERIGTVPAGANGLIFHPYLNGERAPLWTADARGSFSGLTMNHQAEDMLRAVLEGICLNLYDVFNDLIALAGKPTKIMATGGFSRSELWRQMIADVFNQEISLPESFESSCLGAAVLGMKGLGLVDSLHVVKSMIGAEHQHVPNQEAQATYQLVYPVFHQLSRKMQESYSIVAELQRKLM
ncbi:gluconokinase [Carnobacterium gallinarum]|uniref:gluconokinase n=1 Tax=Carnobacterium gallinarum TaxID=2749 RepID=UPI000552AB67